MEADQTVKKVLDNLNQRISSVGGWSIVGRMVTETGGGSIQTVSLSKAENLIRQLLAQSV